MKISLESENPFVWQWDTRKRVVLEGYPEGTPVHFSNHNSREALVVLSRMDGDKLVADIPPELMQEPNDIAVYICDEYNTQHIFFVSVISRTKPESYVYEPVEVLRYESLAVKIPFDGGYNGKLLYVIDGVARPLIPGEGVEIVRQVDGSYALVACGGGAVAEHNASETAHPDIRRMLANLLPREELPEAIENALAQAKESGEFDGAAGPQGPQGPPGDDYVLTDADRQEIAELAAGLVEVPNVKPVAKTEDMTQPVGVDDDGRLWSAPTAGGSGGGCSIDTWEHINTITVGADTPISITFSADHNGNAFALRKLFCTIQNTEARSTYIVWTITGSNATKKIGLGVTNQAITEGSPLKFLAEIEGNFLKSYLSGTTGNYYRFSHDFVNGLDSCKELSFVWGTGSPFSDGAVVTLYGVRV